MAITAFPFTTSSSNGEIDLRGELNRLFFGSAQEVPKAHLVLLRRMRRDSNDLLIICSCRDAITKEADIELPCPFCLGEGYLWNEEWVSTRRMFLRPTDTVFVGRDQWLGPGVANLEAIVYYMEYTVRPTRFDRIIEMKMNDDGDPVIPYIRKRIYRPDEVVAHSGDNGRIEFYEVRCAQKDSINIEETYKA